MANYCFFKDFIVYNSELENMVFENSECSSEK